MAEAAPLSEQTCKISHIHIECPICCTRFTDPKILDCLHCFCLNCLEELVEKQDPKTDNIVCPVCRQETAVPDKGLSSLANCFFLSSLVDEVNRQEQCQGDTALPTTTCEGCVEGLEAISQCLECNAKFCQTCQEAHGRLQFTKTHRIVTICVAPSKDSSPKDTRKIAESPKCRKHTDQVLCFYCDTCQVLACGKCVAFDHRTAEHEYSEIADSVQSYRKEVEEICQKFEESREQFKAVTNSVEHSRNRLRLMVTQACRDISAKEEEEIAKIRNKSRLLQDKVTQIGQERGATYDKVLNSNRDKMNRADQIIASVKDLMQQADDFELLDLKPKVMHNLEFHKDLQFESAQHSQSFVGFKCHDVVHDADLGEILDEEKWQLKTEFGKEGEGDGEFKFANDVACFSNGDIVVADTTNKRLSMFTSTGCYQTPGVQSETEEGKLKSPWGVAVDSDDMLLVTDGQNVKVYDNNLTFIHQFRPSQDDVEGHSNSALTGIAVDNKNRVAVADSGRKLISLHNLDGSITSNISNEMIDDPCRLTISNKNRLIFTNYKRRVLCVDLTCNEVFNIITSIDGKPVKPTGVWCDDAGDIYVSVFYSKQGDCEIHHYDPEGVHIGRVAHGLRNPLGMTFTPAGDLVVADLHSCNIFHRV